MSTLTEDVKAEVEKIEAEKGYIAWPNGSAESACFAMVFLTLPLSVMQIRGVICSQCGQVFPDVPARPRIR
jgi:hypothetical protein